MTTHTDVRRGEMAALAFSAIWTVLAVLVLQLGCGAGEVGPAGPRGADGEVGAPGAAGAEGSVGAVRLIDARVGGWLDTNRARINALIESHGSASEGYDPTNRPVAVFDWDNTVLKNDIGDATFFWLINHDKIRQPAGKDWGTTSASLNAAGKAALNAACDSLAAAGDPLPTASAPGAACAKEIFKLYDSGTTAAGVAGWTAPLTATMNAQYAWVAQLLAGYTPDEVRGFATAAYEQNSAVTVGATQPIGSNTDVAANGFVEIYEQMDDLIGALQDSGFDVWVLTASPQNVVEPLAEMVGVGRDRVIGIRSKLVGGKLTANLQDCGNAAANSVITYDRGKRCWINKVIFNEPAQSQMARNPDPRKRPVFVLGDSDTDLAMLLDATVLKVVLNRAKVLVMCNALENHEGKWLVQPMFISPRARRTTPYPCMSTLGPGGELLTNEAGARIADQSDPL